MIFGEREALFADGSKGAGAIEPGRRDEAGDGPTDGLFDHIAAAHEAGGGFGMGE